MIRIGSLFSGVEGLGLGLLWAFSESHIAASILFQVEIDPYCRAVLARHFPDADRSITDVRAASASVLPAVDVLIGGFPCTDVSSAGRGEGLQGEHSGLWFHYLRLIREMRPRVVVIENVASGLQRWLGPVRCALSSAGYDTAALQVSAADVGAPHRRERVFVVGHLDGLWEPQSTGHSCEERGRPRDAGWRHTEPGVVRGVDGLPVGLHSPERWPAGRGAEQEQWEPSRRTVRGERWRGEREKALGNCVVPQQAREVGRWLIREVLQP